MVCVAHAALGIRVRRDRSGGGVGFLAIPARHPLRNDGFSASSVGAPTCQTTGEKYGACECRPCRCFWPTNRGASTQWSAILSKRCRKRISERPQVFDCAYARDSCYFLGPYES